MYAKQIAFYDLNGNQHIETLHFNLTTVEIARLSQKFNTDLDFAEYTKKVIDDGDNFKIITLLADIVLAAYGERSADGLRFIKDKEVKDKFEDSLAYAEFLEVLLTQENASMEFAQEVFASETLRAEAKKQTKPSVSLHQMPTPTSSVSEALSNAMQSADIVDTPAYTPEQLQQAMEFLSQQNAKGLQPNNK